MQMRERKKKKPLLQPPIDVQKMASEFRTTFSHRPPREHLANDRGGHSKQLPPERLANHLQGYFGLDKEGHLPPVSQKGTRWRCGFSVILLQRDYARKSSQLLQ